MWKCNIFESQAPSVIYILCVEQVYLSYMCMSNIHGQHIYHYIQRGYIVYMLGSYVSNIYDSISLVYVCVFYIHMGDILSVGNGPPKVI